MAGATERADRILDAAAELLVRHGYRKVTVEDVAARARIGKGTVYLHWRTKRQLFEALALREAVVLAEELVAALRADPATLLPHRLLTTSYLVVMRRPVLRALTTEDAPELQPSGLDRELRSQELLVVERLFDLMAKRGLFRADVPNLRYAMTASTAGYFLLDRIDPTSAELDVQEKADALAYTVRHAFEPAEPPDRETLAAVADEAIAVMEELLPPYLARIYTYDRKQRTP
ncbi:MAG: TetR family transcriptional regulator [Streptosporangiales bacterium]|nr:TetR family transcriptional regulator [Streptosporangiales bacterium]